MLCKLLNVENAVLVPVLLMIVLLFVSSHELRGIKRTLSKLHDDVSGMVSQFPVVIFLSTLFESNDPFTYLVPNKSIRRIRAP
jgi:C4-dicarboxylate transporter